MKGSLTATSAYVVNRNGTDLVVDFQLIDNAAAYQTAVPEARRLFERVFERQFPADIWNQWYFKNPYGDPLVIMGTTASTVVAHHAFVPQRLVDQGGNETQYMLSISSMVDPQWRSWSLFNQMITRLHNAAAARGYATTLVLPNAKASELYRVLYRYRVLVETPLCTWIPRCQPNGLARKAPRIEPDSIDTLSYPTDSCYWSWRVSVNGAQSVDLDDRSKVVIKVSADGVLTVLDVISNSSDPSAEQLWGLANSLGAHSVRLTALHANAFGIDAAELSPHEGYVARLMCRDSSDDIPKIRFSLLLSDAF